MKKEHQALLDEIKESVDEAIDPDKMTAGEADEFLEDLIGHLQVWLDALREDARREGGGADDE